MTARRPDTQRGREVSERLTRQYAQRRAEQAETVPDEPAEAASRQATSGRSGRPKGAKGAGPQNALPSLPSALPSEREEVTARGPLPLIVRLDSVIAEPVTWLWNGRIPAGKLVTLDGDPGLGKSTIALTIAAHLSRGRPWPDGAQCPEGDTLILSAEDGLADTMRPRLDAAGADPSRIHALTAVKTSADHGTVTRPVTLADTGIIRSAIEDTGARLLVVDVLMAYLPAGRDANSDQDVRSVLHGVAEIADDTGATVLLLRHLNKGGSGSSPMYRGGGSIGIVGAARAGYVVGADPDDDTGRVLACVKLNIGGSEPDSLKYRLDGDTGTDAARVVWGEASPHRAADLLNRSDDEYDERREVEMWLSGVIADRAGTVAAKDAFGAAGQLGYSRDQVKRAKKRLGLVAEKVGMSGGWHWTDPALSTPEGSAKGAKGADS
ncbi:AAA family ATPase [Actinomycetospora endophytica]|uniref:AAA family ATPase n=1 Tax=Actinomycetospora endophytica TaxID=2291215 RepID=A0ABS8PCR9_9PSEU|nr:AAA family ATPase [Actinomycetospora endophytica]MCD2195697.1 AAA family ATPase [Actinomycetospora endophytica]